MTDDPHSFTETIKHVVDGLSGAVALATVIKVLPAIAAAMSIIWTGIRIYEWWRKR